MYNPIDSSMVSPISPTPERFISWEVLLANSPRSEYHLHMAKPDNFPRSSTLFIATRVSFLQAITRISKLLRFNVLQHDFYKPRQ